MNEARVLRLEQFLREDENDSFSRYALALEYKESDPAKAIAILEDLRRLDPKYKALYYHLAELYTDTDQPDLARSIFEQGILLLENSTDAHALKELKNA